MRRPSKQKVASAMDVARVAGVSQSAVSRAFTDGASLSAAKREKILEVAADLGYRPNILARSLIKQTSMVAGVIVGSMENPFFAAALDRLTTALSVLGLRVLLFPAETNTTADEQISELLSYRVSAVILMAVNMSSTLANDCARAGIPVVLFNRTAANIAEAYAVVGDNEVGAAAIADHFVQARRRRIAFMAGYEESSTSYVREQAFGRALEKAGCPLAARAKGNYSRAGAIEASRTLFRDPAKRPDAIFCANDVMAIATIETLRSEFGITPGQECAVVGFDDIPMASWPSFMLTTYSQPLDVMVSRTVDLVVGRDLPDDRCVIVKGALIMRSSA
jgi:DNA-binding LacI/PurR family transcriptional regulator